LDYGPNAGNCSRLLDILERQSFAARLWAKDPTVWRQGPDTKELSNRLGWLEIMSEMMQHVDELTAFADEVKQSGFKHVVLMGMGGSSLSPEVSKLAFGVQPGYPDLLVLDSTVPESVLKVQKAINPKETLFIVAMKSGSTVETNSCYRYFYQQIPNGDNFIAITDPGTSLQTEAETKKFRKLFLNNPEIGGRFSALSFFGLVPAAVIGVDLRKLLGRAQEMADSCKPEVPLAQNPGMLLGVLLAEHALRGRDKLTLVLPDETISFGYWVEQLVAESTGKFGQGVLPVESEPLAGPDAYDDDRVFAYTRLKGQKNAGLDAGVTAIEDAGFPVIRIEMDDAYDIGKEYFRWEMAASAACALLGVNAFDQPNVQESKDLTKSVLQTYEQTGSLPVEAPILSDDGISIYCDSTIKAELDAMKSGASVESYINAFVDLYQPGNYFALMAFISPSEATDTAFGEMRKSLRDRFKTATTLGYGPRFLHSTGQFHKGGPNNGIFIQFTADNIEPLRIPAVDYSFSTLKSAQALGDASALKAKGRPFLRIHLGSDIAGGLAKVLKIIG
jgi:transaldolase / glucose-6-phosphate isomerase